MKTGWKRGVGVMAIGLSDTADFSLKGEEKRIWERKRLWGFS